MLTCISNHAACIKNAEDGKLCVVQKHCKSISFQQSICHVYLSPSSIDTPPPHILQSFGLYAVARSSGVKFGNGNVSSFSASLWAFLAFTVLIGGLRLNLIFAALQLSPMSIVHTLMSGSPVLVMLLSHCLLNKDDQFTVLKGVASVLLVGGILLNANPMDAIRDAVSKNSLDAINAV